MIIAVVFLLGCGTGIGGTIAFVHPDSLQSAVSIVDPRDKQIAELTAALNDIRRQLAADAQVRAEDERRMRAFNVVPTELAKPKTYEIGK